MWKTVKQFFKQIRSDYGFTLIEAITLIAVLSVLGVVLWSGATLAMRATTDMNTALDASSTVLKAEHLLRRKCANVRFPFWLNSCVLEITENTLTMNHYNGNKEDTLKLSFTDEQLWIIENITDTEQGMQEQKEPLGPFAKAEFSPAQSENRGVYGISVTLWPAQDEKQEEETMEEEEIFTITVEFGSTPLRSMNNNE